jgi:hypothetical protein
MDRTHLSASFEISGLNISIQIVVTIVSIVVHVLGTALDYLVWWQRKIRLSIRCIFLPTPSYV